MVLPVDCSADSDLSVKCLTAEELIIGPDQEASDGEIDGDDENEAVYFVQLGEEILQVGHMQKQKAQSDGGNCKKADSSHLLSLQWCRPSQQQQEMTGFAGPSCLISLSLICKEV